MDIYAAVTERIIEQMEQGMGVTSPFCKQSDGTVTFAKTPRHAHFLKPVHRRQRQDEEPFLSRQRCKSFLLFSGGFRYRLVWHKEANGTRMTLCSALT